MTIQKIIDNIKNNFNKIEIIRYNKIYFNENNELYFSNKGLINFINNLLFIKTRRETLNIIMQFIMSEIDKYKLSEVHNITLNSNMLDDILLPDIYIGDENAINILFNKIYLLIDKIIYKLIKQISNVIKTKKEIILKCNNQETIIKLNENVSLLTNRLIKIIGIDIFEISKNITINLMKLINDELIVKYKSYHKRIIIRTLKKLNFDMKEYLGEGKQGAEIGSEFESFVYNKLIDNIINAHNYVKRNVTIKNNKTHNIKPEFDIVIGNFVLTPGDKNTYLIDTIIDVKKSVNGIYSDTEKFKNGINFLESNNVELVIDGNTYTKHPNQKTINKIYIYDLENHSNIPFGIILSVFFWYIMNIKKNFTLITDPKNYFFDLIRLMKLEETDDKIKTKIRLQDIINIKTIGKYSDDSIENMIVRELKKFNNKMFEIMSEFAFYKII